MRMPASCAVSDIWMLIGTLRTTTARLSPLVAIMMNQITAAHKSEKISSSVLFSKARSTLTRFFSPCSFFSFLPGITFSPSFYPEGS